MHIGTVEASATKHRGDLNLSWCGTGCTPAHPPLSKIPNVGPIQLREPSRNQSAKQKILQ